MRVFDNSPGRWRLAAAGLAAGVLVGGTVAVVAPAVATRDTSYAATNWKKIWKKELKKYADKRYYTTTQSDAKYSTKAETAAGLGNVYTKAQSDANYYSKAAVDAKLAPFVNSVAAFAGGDQVVALTVEEVVRSVSIVPPANGKVVVSSSAYMRNTNAGATTLRCSITTGTALDFDALQFKQFADAGGTDVIAATRGFDVTKGNLLTVNLVCDQFLGAGSVEDTALTAIFAPS